MESYQKEVDKLIPYLLEYWKDTCNAYLQFHEILNHEQYNEGEPTGKDGKIKLIGSEISDYKGKLARTIGSNITKAIAEGRKNTVRRMRGQRGGLVLEGIASAGLAAGYGNLKKDPSMDYKKHLAIFISPLVLSELGV